MDRLLMDGSESFQLMNKLDVQVGQLLLHLLRRLNMIR